MKHFIIPFGLSVALCSSALASDVWMTNMEEARKKAAREGKGLFIEFTGSDWCGPCMHFKKTVLSKDEFLKAVTENFVLVELDYPRKKEQDAALREQNKHYAAEYSLTGVPTVIFTDAVGRPVYLLQGARDMPNVLRQIEEANASRHAVARALEELNTVTGDRRFALIGDILNTVPFAFADRFYPDLVNEARKDERDRTGYKAKLNNQTNEEAFRRITKSASRYGGNGSPSFYEHVRDEADKAGIDPELKQRLYGILAQNLVGRYLADEAIDQYAAAIGILPGSDEAARLTAVKERVTANRDRIKLTGRQISEFDQYQRSLDRSLTRDAARYSDALDAYVHDREASLTDEAMAHILHPLVYAKIGVGRADEGFAATQKVIDRMSDPEQKERLILQKKMWECNKDAIKRSWDASRKQATSR